MRLRRAIARPARLRAHEGPGPARTRASPRRGRCAESSRLLLLLLLVAAPVRTAHAETVGYWLDMATGMFWQITVVADDGATSASATLPVFCCNDVNALVVGDLTGIVSPLFTPSKLFHFVDPAEWNTSVGLLPITLDVAGSLRWDTTSGPSLMSGQSAPMDTGDVDGASFLGTLTTPSGAIPFDLDLLDHLGGFMDLHRFSGANDLGFPELRVSTATEPLDTVEIDEDDQPGRVEMISPYDAVVGLTQGVVEAGSVSYSFAGAALLEWQITITGDDGQTAASDTYTVFCCAGVDSSVSGDTVGVVDPVFTPHTVDHSIALSGAPLQVGVIPVMLNLSALLGWSPTGPSLMSEESGFMATGNATAASFLGTLTTPSGDVPFNLGLLDHTGGTPLSLRRISGGMQVGDPRLQLDSVGGPLDSLEVDENGEPGRVELLNPYQAVLGTAGGVTWSISATLYFNASFYDLALGPPNGLTRDVTWTLQSELVFNDLVYLPEPSSAEMIVACVALLFVLSRLRRRARTA
jgi:hypothetical protein